MKHNTLLQGALSLLALTLIVFVVFKARNAFQEYNYIGKFVRDRDVITITGEGKISATPDLALLHLGVTTDGATVRETQQRNTEKMNAILIAMKSLGISEKDLQTTNYSIFPKQEWRDGRSTISGYRVSQNVTAKIRNLDLAGEALAKAGELGANQVGGIQFTIDEPKKLQEEARNKAIADAREKAETLVKQLGLAIVKVVTFSESGGQQPLPMMYDRGMGAPMAMEAAPAPNIEPGSLDVTSFVSVVFEVR